MSADPAPVAAAPAQDAGPRCTVLADGYQASPTGSPARFQLQDVVGVMRR